ncbi:substrate-binding periplasmic protein [Atopomonas sediminilitoris]|uniref:substrate-binding periplasmic protein n=1 Tax=Atopomonas sediminilitoris TaxID=2919919 RepID=UPI001F4F019D|nr:transporter substrate-binding domain-containing protein [Atopomonas sediminilitoris]
MAIRRLGLFGLLLSLCSQALAAPPIVIGAEDDWYPFTGIYQQQLQGLSVELVEAAFAASTTPITFKVYPYARCMHLARIGKLAGCFNTAADASLSKDFAFSAEPLFRAPILLWQQRRDTRQIQHFSELELQRVAVTLGYEYGPAFDNQRLIHRVPTRKDLFGLRMLARKRVDFAVAYLGTTLALFEDHPKLSTQVRAGGVIANPELHLSFSRRHPQGAVAKQRFDAGFATLKSSGEYARIVQRWQRYLGDGARYPELTP